MHGDKGWTAAVLGVPAVLDQLLVACREALRHVRPRAVEHLVQDLHTGAHVSRTRPHAVSNGSSI